MFCALPLSPLAAQTVQVPSRAVASPCELAGEAAERQYALPAGLLGAIGRVESGRWDAALGRTVPWPWAIDAAGTPHVLDSKQEALQRARALQDSGVRNMDVGCFQINLRSHPSAFTDLEEAFDPAANADYAARFLTLLHARLGTWEEAVAAYHSSTPAYGAPYRQLVYANWSPPAAAATGSNVKPASSVTVYSVAGAEVRVWTPGPVGAAAAPANMQLPRIITPGG